MYTVSSSYRFAGHTSIPAKDTMVDFVALADDCKRLENAGTAVVVLICDRELGLVSGQELYVADVTTPLTLTFKLSLATNME
ncbi:hypothetical protein MAR_010700 [Mya arenaria]|uniref:Uncharacterized protein n=1 Tax=Mya arenaria TaxID=6604 RepID=A0ABY7FW86_MYAAR|nr:hypothetical protein MAR_010700 [Mya arenaria]